MMTQEEINKFSELSDKFYNDCYRVTEILGRFKVFTQHWSNDIRYADNFTVNGNSVEWDGSDRENDCISGSFPVEYLFMTDSEVEEKASEQNEKYLEEIRKEMEDIKERELQSEYETYLRLRNKFEGIRTL